jgi:ATP adenylyltransferase/5',5'''-P-1,P-4-tetraphosphate phosphorylase II
VVFNLHLLSPHLSRPRSTPQQLEALASQLHAACRRGLGASVSYNVLLWRDAMVMVPRSQECAGPCAIK